MHRDFRYIATGEAGAFEIRPVPYEGWTLTCNGTQIIGPVPLSGAVRAAGRYERGEPSSS